MTGTGGYESGRRSYGQEEHGEEITGDSLDQDSSSDDSISSRQEASSHSVSNTSDAPATYPQQLDLLVALEQAMAAQEASARASSLAAEEYRKLIKNLKS